jgi:hypothetical protein
VAAAELPAVAAVLLGAMPIAALGAASWRPQAAAAM